MSAKRHTEEPVLIPIESTESEDSTQIDSNPSEPGLFSRMMAWWTKWRQDFAQKKAERNAAMDDADSNVHDKKGKKNGLNRENSTNSTKPAGSSKSIESAKPIGSTKGSGAKGSGRAVDSGKSAGSAKTAGTAKSTEAKMSQSEQSVDPVQEKEREQSQERERLLCCRPVADRGLYRTALQRGWKRILEIGIHDGSRGQNLLACAATQNPKDSLFYAGIDLFEASGDVDGTVSLKEAQKMFTPLAGKTRLLPGEPLSVLKANAKSIGTFDAIILSTGMERKTIDQCWEIFMQLCHDDSVVLVEPSPKDRRPRWRCLTSEDVLEIADWKASKK